MLIGVKKQRIFSSKGALLILRQLKKIEREKTGEEYLPVLAARDTKTKSWG